MTTRSKLLALALLAPLAAGCAGHDKARRAADGAARGRGRDRGGGREDRRKTREVHLRSAGRADRGHGRAEVRNLAQVAAGDRVRVSYYERGRPHGRARHHTSDTPPPWSPAVLPGAEPAGMLGATVSMVVTLVSYDPATALATFTTPRATPSVVVSGRMQAFAAAASPATASRSTSPAPSP